MHIHYQEKRYSIQQKPLAAFLRERGFPQEAIDRLIIHVRLVHPKRYFGEFKYPHTIYLYVYDDPAEEVNNTLLHELRHYWQDLQADKLAAEEYRQLEEHYKQLRGRAKQKYYEEHLLWHWHPNVFPSRPSAPSEYHIPYGDRPGEHDACAFASQFSHARFLEKRDMKIQYSAIRTKYP